MMDLIEKLYPICRSITGDGVRRTLDQLGARLNLDRHEVPSGTSVFDWEIPPEWNIRDAYIADDRGRRLVDFRVHNLHVLNYSVPVHERLSREALAAHVFTMPDRPEWIPYRTSYYREAWGFCMSHNQWTSMPEGEYEVCVDASLEPGYLSLAECVLPGETEEEILFSTHICHPSLCNDNLSGIAVQTRLFEWLAERPRRYTYRGVFVPGTIGSLTWLWLNREALGRIRGGVVLSGLGDRGGFTYKRSRRGSSWVDRVMSLALADCGESWQERDFTPYGYDERQYCSPGFDLPVGRLSRTPYAEYPEYHTSADDLHFVSQRSLDGSLALCQRFVEYLESDRIWINQSPYGEPQLGKRGLYGSVGGAGGPDDFRLAMLWVLNLADGGHTLTDMAERSSMSPALLGEAATALSEAGLLAEATDSNHASHA